MVDQRLPFRPRKPLPAGPRTARSLTASIRWATGCRRVRRSAGIINGTFSYDADDRMSSTEQYDNNGNTLASGARTFKYDFENRLKSMNNGAVQLQYDGDGNRVAKAVGSTTTRYLVDDLNPTGYAQVVEELTNGVVTRTYTYGLQRISQTQSAGTTFYGYDGMGSVRMLTDATGAMTDSYDYDASGNVVGSSGNTPNLYRYRGEQFDPDLQLYYLRARYFNPLTGRFLWRDPESRNFTIAGTLHKYLYTGADPVNRLDATGQDWLFGRSGKTEFWWACLELSWLIAYELCAHRKDIHCWGWKRQREAYANSPTMNGRPDLNSWDAEKYEDDALPSSPCLKALSRNVSA